jgi:hypothetical protein
LEGGGAVSCSRPSTRGSTAADRFRSLSSTVTKPRATSAAMKNAAATKARFHSHRYK